MTVHCLFTTKSVIQGAGKEADLLFKYILPHCIYFRYQNFHIIAANKSLFFQSCPLLRKYVTPPKAQPNISMCVNRGRF